MRMFQGDVEKDAFCRIIIDTLKSGSKIPAHLKRISMRRYKEWWIEKYSINPTIEISEGEYYYRLRRLVREKMVTKSGGCYYTNL